MADFSVTGFIIGTRYNTNSITITVAENRKGYKKKDGTIVEDAILAWKVSFKPYFKKFIAEHFGEGMLVHIKGIVLPYGIDGKEFINGYTIWGQTIDMASYPKNIRREVKMQKESQSQSETPPDLKGYEQDDF